MKLTWTYFSLVAGALLFLPKAAIGQNLAECFLCITELPDAVDCLLELPSPPPPSVLDCDIAFSPPYLQNCVLGDCINDVVTCLYDCLPTCMDETAKNLDDCVLDPASNCFSDPAACIIPAIGPLPPLDIGLCNLSELLADPLSCAILTWPTCDNVQDTVITITCALTDCCSACHDEKNALESCIYNWLSGENCNFQCPPRRRRRRAAQVTDHSPVVSQEAEQYEHECKVMLATDLMLQPDKAVDDYMECILNRTVELAAAEEQSTESRSESGVFSPALLALPIGVTVLSAHLLLLL
jgi:hypothetical protein